MAIAFREREDEDFDNLSQDDMKTMNELWNCGILKFFWCWEIHVQKNALVSHWLLGAQ